MSSVETVEIDLLLEGIYRHYGIDFRNYAPSTIRRQLQKRVQAENVPSLSALQGKILRDSECMQRLLLDLSIGTTAMFRDPDLYLAIRNKVVPLLRTYPFIRIWHAGCSTGEEVYSLAILLKEEGLYDRARIYATDFHRKVLDIAAAGSFPMENAEKYSRNHFEAGGKFPFSNYYVADHKDIVMDPSLIDNVSFFEHNLVSDQSFQEFNLIFCRNVLIYFDKDLQNRVHDLIYRSLCRFGILCLGEKESLDFTSHEKDYRAYSAKYKIYQKMR